MASKQEIADALEHVADNTRDTEYLNEEELTQDDLEDIAYELLDLASDEFRTALVAVLKDQEADDVDEDFD